MPHHQSAGNCFCDVLADLDLHQLDAGLDEAGDVLYQGCQGAGISKWSRRSFPWLMVIKIRVFCGQLTVDNSSSWQKVDLRDVLSTDFCQLAISGGSVRLRDYFFTTLNSSSATDHIPQRVAFFFFDEEIGRRTNVAPMLCY